MADTKLKDGAQDLGDYATRHPRRMATGMFALGTAIGAGMMAAKKNNDKNALQKFMDQLSK